MDREKGKGLPKLRFSHEEALQFALRSWRGRVGLMMTWSGPVYQVKVGSVRVDVCMDHEGGESAFIAKLLDVDFGYYPEQLDNLVEAAAEASAWMKAHEPL